MKFLRSAEVYFICLDPSSLVGFKEESGNQISCTDVYCLFLVQKLSRESA